MLGISAGVIGILAVVYLLVPPEVVVGGHAELGVVNGPTWVEHTWEVVNLRLSPLYIVDAAMQADETGEVAVLDDREVGFLGRRRVRARFSTEGATGPFQREVSFGTTRGAGAARRYVRSVAGEIRQAIFLIGERRREIAVATGDARVSADLTSLAAIRHLEVSASSPGLVPSITLLGYADDTETNRWRLDVALDPARMAPGPFSEYVVVSTPEGFEPRCGETLVITGETADGVERLGPDTGRRTQGHDGP